MKLARKLEPPAGGERSSCLTFKLVPDLADLLTALMLGNYAINLLIEISAPYESYLTNYGAGALILIVGAYFIAERYFTSSTLRQRDLQC